MNEMDLGRGLFVYEGAGDERDGPGVRRRVDAGEPQHRGWSDTNSGVSGRDGAKGANVIGSTVSEGHSLLLLQIW
jgi:hypothetical protein